MTFQSLTDITLLAPHIDPQSDTSTVRTGTSVDMAGYDGVMFIITTGAMVATATLDALVQHSTTTVFTVAVATTGGAITQLLAANDASAVYVIDVKTQTIVNQTTNARYVRLQVTPAVAATLFSVVSLKYRHSGANAPTQTSRQTVSV